MVVLVFHISIPNAFVIYLVKFVGITDLGVKCEIEL